MSTIDEIKARIDIVDLVSETVQLRRSGKSYLGFCPFHSNTRTPAFAVFPESGTWRCFGQCAEGGDIFKFVMKKEGYDFAEALRFLAEKAGVEIRPPTPEERAEAEEHEALRSLLEDAVTFYRHQLVHTEAGKPALEYLRQKRQLTDETIEAFSLGYAPNSWDATLHYFTGKGYSQADLQAVGLVTERESGGVYDRFRNRIMFPIRDGRGRMCGFGARILNPDDIPKFLNSPQTVVFDKGGLLYGLDRARKAIRAQDCAVIVEGYLDVIALHQAGFTNTVSPMGTALTEAQLALLKPFSRRFVLALDADAAGNQATMRGLQVARQALDRENEVTFNVRGLLSQEARLKADIRVTTLPEGLDPDEVVQQDAQLWANILEHARPLVVHVMESLAQGRDLDDAKTKSEIASQVLPLIEDVPNPVERDAYRQRLARLLRVNERALLELAPAAYRPARTPTRRPPRQGKDATAPLQVSATQPPTQSPSKASHYALELHCLGVLLRQPDLLSIVDRRMLEEGLPRLSSSDFQYAEHQTILQLFRDSVEQDMAEPINFVLNSLELPMMEMADGLLERTTEMDPKDERVLEDLMRGLLELRRRQLHQEIEYVRYLMEQDAANSGEYLRQVAQQAEIKRRIDRAYSRYSHSTGLPTTAATTPASAQAISTGRIREDEEHS